MTDGPQHGGILSHVLVAAITVVATVTAEQLVGARATHLEIGGVGVLMILAVLLAAFVYHQTIAPVIRSHTQSLTSDLAKISQSLTGDLTRVARHLERISLGIQDNPNTNADTEVLERRASTVCVVTKDFYWDLHHDFSAVMVENVISRGVRYRYFCPDNEMSRAAVRELARRLPAGYSISVTFVPPLRMEANLFEFILYDASDRERSEGILVDVFWRRYSAPEHCIDLRMEKRSVLPMFKRLIDEWGQEFQSCECAGTRSA